MSKNLELTDERLAEALRCCAKSDAAVCRKCPMELREQDGKCCFDALRLKAADRLMELHGATEKICEREINEMVRLAKECNLALDRGLAGASDANFAKATEHQQVLTELGRQSVIHSVPHRECGMRIDWIDVDGRRVYGEEGVEDA